MPAQDLTSADFESKIGAAKVALVDFYAPWCGPCKMLAPVVDEIANEMGDSAGIYKLNVDEAQDIAAKYNVASIPTVIFFKNGKVADVGMSVMSKDTIKAKLKNLGA